MGRARFSICHDAASARKLERSTGGPASHRACRAHPQLAASGTAAVKALAAPEFGLHHAASALAGPTIAIVVNGPIAARLGINATNNVFGPGARANATIGRALRLVLLNCLKYRPGVSDRATMGTP